MSKARVFLGVVIAVVVGVVVVVVWWFVGGVKDTPGSSPQPSATASKQEASSAPSVSVAPTSSPAVTASAVTGVNREDAESVAQAFASVWVDPDMPADQWIKELSSLSTPAFIESVKTSDRKLAASMSDEKTVDFQQILGGFAVSFGRGDESFAVDLVQDFVGLDDEGGERFEWRVSGVTYQKVPEGAAVPLGLLTEQELNQEFLEAAYAVYGDPGGMTDADRVERLKRVFRDPVQAVKIPRTGTAEDSIVTGNVTGVSWDVDDKGRIVAHLNTTYAPDYGGEKKIEYVSFNVVIERGDGGKWVLVDAYQ